jgi:hypothetical protein
MTDVITYNTELEQLLKENSEECESLSILHRMSYEKYNKRSNYINIPVIILSSAIGFITGIDLQYDRMNIILGVGSVFVGIIKSVDTYFQLAKRAESHRICSLQFSQISKKIQIELTLHRRQRATAENMMNIVKTDIKNMQDIAPLIDDDIIELYNMKYRRYKRVKKPNFVNGLTEVKVNPYNDEREYEFASRHGSREASPNNEMNDDGRSPSSPPLFSSSSQQPPQPPQPPSLQQPQIQQQFNENPNDDDDVSVGPVIQPNLTVITNRSNSQQPQKSQPQSQSQSQSQPQQPQQPQEIMSMNMDNTQVLQLLQQLQNGSTKSPSPATSIRSASSLQLGQIQTDNSGNQGMNI